jgi:hypothetical protein
MENNRHFSAKPLADIDMTLLTGHCGGKPEK